MATTSDSPFSFLGSQLQSKSGLVDVSVLDSAPAVAVYFSAHWCPPCRGFTPVLSEFYESANEDEKQVEIVFVSCDRSQEQFDGYYGEMPWLAVPWNPNTVQAIKQKIPFSGIPYLVVLNKDGSIKSTDGRADVSSKGPGCLDSWKN